VEHVIRNIELPPQLSFIPELLYDNEAEEEVFYYFLIAAIVIFIVILIFLQTSSSQPFPPYSSIPLRRPEITVLD
jgi:hypothetical protein